LLIDIARSRSVSKRHPDSRESQKEFRPID